MNFYEMKLNDPCSFFLMLLLSSSERGHENSGLNEDSNPDLCNSGAVLFQLSHQATWELLVFVMRVDYEP